MDRHREEQLYHSPERKPRAFYLKTAHEMTAFYWTTWTSEEESLEPSFLATARNWTECRTLRVASSSFPCPDGRRALEQAFLIWPNEAKAEGDSGCILT